MVGYVNTELNQGFQPGGSSFAAISGGEYNIQDIKPIAPEGEAETAEETASETEEEPVEHEPNTFGQSLNAYVEMI